jgi:hypothetical protein
MWLIPLVWGWFAVGTHHGRRMEVIDEIRDTLELNMESKDSVMEDTISLSEPNQHHLIDSEGRIPRHKILGFIIREHAISDGPFYNYARCASWTHLSQTIIDRYRNAISRPPNSHLTSLDGGDSVSPKDPLFAKDSEVSSTAEFSQMQHRHTTLGSTTPTARRVRAFVAAFLLQAVFGWSAFMIDYTTPTIGVGCRAFICATYTMISLFSCVLFAMSSVISDRLKSSIADRNTRRWVIAAAFMRIMGIFMAISNGIFIIVACFFEFIGVYESCFCKSDYLSLRGRAFVSFLSSEQAAGIARPFWYVGSGIAMLTVLVVCFGYFTKIHKKVRIE